MTRRHHALWFALAFTAAAPAALLACSKSTTYTADTAVAEADAWINGGPFSFVAPKGEVVLVEAWHRN
jgi:hypothetical protein